jgi:dihydroorotate dehydrogenase (fumarate)
MVDLTTTYLGMKLKNPLVASPSPYSEKVDMVKRMEDAGLSAVVLYSLFEEQIIHESLELDHYLTQGTESFAEAISYLPDTGKYSLKPERYVEHLSKVKQAVNIPVIGSLNGVSSGGWVKWAKHIEEAGADALELNIYFLPNDPHISSLQLEHSYASLVKDVKEQVSIPVAVKLSPYFTAIPNIMNTLVNAGADALVLFNRFYQPDFDLQELEVVPNLVLSTSNELRLPLRWIAMLYGKVRADLALTSGVHTAEDVIKGIMAGASVTMTTSALLKYGVGRATDILEGVKTWMEEREYESITQMKGSMCQQSVAEPGAFERANYMKVLSSFKALP